MDQFRARLLSVSNGITSEELGQLKFVSKQHIPAGVLEKIARPLELFDELENRNLLSERNTMFLAELLSEINRLDLKDELLGVKARNRSGDAVLKHMQESLWDHYQKNIGWIQPISWNDSFWIHIEHIYTNLEIISLVSQGRNCIQKPLNSYPMMFHSRPGCSKPRRILVEGEAGVGKSTFLCKIAHDWSRGNGKLLPFTVVILIELKQIKGSFKDAIIQQLFPADFPIPLAQLLSYLASHQENVLFLLDGFDEANLSCLTHLRDILSGRIFRNSCVVLTSRPGKTTHIQRMMDTRLVITGFTTENIRSYVLKYFQDDPSTAELLLSELETHPVIEDIAKVPLTAMLICALWEDAPDTAFEALSTVTTLFTELILLMVKRNLAKNAADGEATDEVFTVLEDIPKDLYNDLLIVGEIAFNGLLEDNLLFDVQALEKKLSSKTVFEFGLLSQETSTSRLKPVRKCCFVHKSFQEYVAALWLSHEINCAANDSSKLKNVLSLTLKCVSKASDSMLLNFVAGLVGDNFESVFVPLLENLKEAINTFDSGEANDFLVMFVLALFESHQGHLASKLGATLLDGILKFSGHDISPYGVRAMTYFMQNNPDLKSFVLEHSQLEKQTAAFFANSLSQMPSLRELCFNQNIVGDGVVEAFSRNLSFNLPLERFVFSGNASRRDIGNDFALIMKSCPNLCHLDLSYSGFGDEDMKDVIDALKFVPSLKSLDLSGCKLTQISMAYLLKKLSCTAALTSLSLENNIDLGAEGVRALAEGLSKVPHLENLSLHYVNRKTDVASETSRIIFTALGEAFTYCPKLKRLDLSANLLHQGKFVGDCVRKAPRLVSLDLSGNAFQDEGAESLASALPWLPCLSELLLDKNQITCNGLITLCESFNCTPYLCKLSLKSNCISDKGVAALAAVAPYICQMNELCLGYNNITEAGLNALCTSFKSFSSLQCLDFKGNMLSEEGISELGTKLCELPKLRNLYIWSPVAQLPMDQPTETARPLEFSPATKLFPGHKDLEKWRHSITFTDDKHLRYYVAFKQETFQLLMASAHSHTSLEGIYLSQTAIPRGTDQQIYPRLRLVGQYRKEL